MTFATEAYITLSQEEVIIGLTGGLTPDGVRNMTRKRRWLYWEKRLNPTSGKVKKFLIVSDPFKEDKQTGEQRIKLILDEIRTEGLVAYTKLWDDTDFIPYCEEMVYGELPHKTEGVNTQVMEDATDDAQTPSKIQNPTKSDPDSLIVGVMGMLSDLKRAESLNEVKELGDSLCMSIKDIYDYHIARVLGEKSA